MTAAAPPFVEAGSQIATDAELGPGVWIGPFCRIGPGVVLEEGVRLTSHVSVEGPTRIGAHTLVHPFAALGGPPQHSRYRGEVTTLVIGAQCTIHEHVTIHRGTPFGRGQTTLGAQVLVMAGAHVGHDCQIGDNAVIAGQSGLGGHVEVGAHTIIGGGAMVHQFCRIGTRAIVGGGAAVDADVIPYGSALGNRARLGGLNLTGLKRAGLPRATIHALRHAYTGLFLTSDGLFADRLVRVAEAYADVPEVMSIIAFLRDAGHRPVLGASKDG
ncbi:MAG: acyl-ACP--UDP-N-acetylglucosamine O-acyltransferase [Cypionkella sp.]